MVHGWCRRSRRRVRTSRRRVASASGGGETRRRAECRRCTQRGAPRTRAAAAVSPVVQALRRCAGGVLVCLQLPVLRLRRRRCTDCSAPHAAAQLVVQPPTWNWHWRHQALARAFAILAASTRHSPQVGRKHVVRTRSAVVELPAPSSQALRVWMPSPHERSGPVILTRVDRIADLASARTTRLQGLRDAPRA